MTKTGLVLAFCLTVAAVPTLALGYDWPLRPWNNDPVHGVTGVLGEFRPPWRGGGYHFHEGIDIDGAAFDSVFASDSGRVGRRGATHVQIGDKIYRHIVRYRRYLHDYLSGDKTVPQHFHIADVQHLVINGRDQSHLHLEELNSDSIPINPFAPNHLVTAPGFDTEWPQVINMWFQPDNTDTCLPEQSGTTIVRGKVEIVSRAKDEMPDPGSENVSIYRMAYLLRDWKANLVSDSIESCCFDTMPSHDEIFNCYQRIITFADSSRDTTTKSKYYYIATWRNGSQYDYWNTKQKKDAAENVDADSIGEAKYPDERYRVSVLAWDRAGHGGLEDSARGADTAWVVVDNFLPIVVSTVPADSATDVGRNANIEATFSEPVDEETITPSRVIVVNQSDTTDTVAGALSYEDSTYTLTFDPDTLLEADVEYEVTISDSITDLVGNRLDGNENGVPGGDYSWRFRVQGIWWLHADEEDAWMGNPGYPNVAAALEFVNTLSTDVKLLAVTYNFDEGFASLGHIWLSDGTGKPKWKDPEHWQAERDFDITFGGFEEDTRTDLEEPYLQISPGQHFWVGWQIQYWQCPCYTGWNFEGDPPYYSWWWNTYYWRKMCEGEYPDLGDFTMEVLVEPVD